jgi:hypothetical protein
MKIKYRFKDFTLNGLGADFFRICKLVHCYNLKNKVLVMEKHDNWELVPNDIGKNWRYFFSSLKLESSHDVECVTDSDIKELETVKIKFEILSNICRDLYKPNDYMIDSYHIDKPFAVMHIRCGDKISGPWSEGIKHNISEYYDKIKDDYEKQNIFVMTDSQKVANDAHELGFIVDLNEIRRDGFVYKHYSEPYSYSELKDEAKTFFKNMEIFKKADQLVGSNASFFYLIGQLLNGHPGISLSENLYYNSAI